MPQPRVVTVAVPVYNGAGDLEELLTAVRAQRLDEPVEVEILISDSGSTDDSVAIAERFGEFGVQPRDQGARRARGDHERIPGDDL